MGWVSTQGALTRTVRDSAAILDVLAGEETGDPYWAPPPERPFTDEVGAPVERLRIGFTTISPTGSPVEPEPIAAVEEAGLLLEELGHQVTEVTPDWSDPNLTPMFLAAVQTGTVYYPGTDLDKIEPLNRMLAETGMTTNSLDYVRAMEGLKAMSRRVVALWMNTTWSLRRPWRWCLPRRNGPGPGGPLHASHSPGHSSRSRLRPTSPASRRPRYLCTGPTRGYQSESS